MAKRDEKQKASDVFRESNYGFPKKVSFEEAFPEIEDVAIQVEEVGYMARQKGKRVYGKELGEFADCSNPMCYKGGISVGSILRDMVHNRQTKSKTSKMCRGHEGSPKQRDRDCINDFAVEVSITYKQA